VPDFVTSIIFLQECRQRINDGGSFILNYMVASEAAWADALKNLQEVFPTAVVDSIGINRVITACL